MGWKEDKKKEIYPQLKEKLLSHYDIYCTASLIQRWFRVGYSFATELLEKLRKDGLVELVAPFGEDDPRRLHKIVR